MKEKQIRETVREAILGEARNYDHTDNLETVRNLTIPDIEPGHFVKFPYETAGGDARDREVFVISPRYKDKIHGLDIGYLSERQIVRLFANVFDRLSPQARDMMKETFPRVLTTGPISKSQSFYRDVVKQLPDVKAAYRTFRHDRIRDGLIQRAKYHPTINGDIMNYLEEDGVPDPRPEAALRAMVLSEVRESREAPLRESEVMDSRYLQNMIGRMKPDFSGDELEVLEYIEHRLNQSYPGGDVTKEDVIDIMKEPSIRDTALNLHEFIDYIWQ